MKVLIIEDEIPAAKKIERLIKEIDDQIERNESWSRSTVMESYPHLIKGRE